MKRILTMCCLCITFFSVTMAQDFPGSEDHPLLTRYEGARILSYGTNNFTDAGKAKNRRVELVKRLK